MYSGLERGSTSSVSSKVTKEMFPSFDGEVVHPVFSTVSLVHHMEWAARRLILPFLEPEEEGMGASVQLKHSSPAFDGDEITAEATVSKVKSKMILCDVEVKRGETTIGYGSVTQVIIPKSYIDNHPERTIS